MCILCISFSALNSFFFVGCCGLALCCSFCFFVFLDGTSSPVNMSILVKKSLVHAVKKCIVYLFKWLSCGVLKSRRIAPSHGHSLTVEKGFTDVQFTQNSKYRIIGFISCL